MATGRYLDGFGGRDEETTRFKLICDFACLNGWLHHWLQCPGQHAKFHDAIGGPGRQSADQLARRTGTDRSRRGGTLARNHLACDLDRLLFQFRRANVRSS